MTTVVEIQGLTKKYGSQIAVNNLSLTIESGEIFGFLGPNGAGKTTTLLMLLGLCEPNSGQALVLGLNPIKEPLKVKRQVGYLPENMGFYGELTAWENLSYIADLNGLNKQTKKERLAEALKIVGLELEVKKPVAAFSRGMRQRLGLAEVLIKDPKLIFLDEPTLGLDPDGINKMLELIVRLSRDRGITIVLSSHLLHLVERISSRVAILKEGVLMALGSVDDLAKETGLPTKLESIYLSFFNEKTK